MAKVLITGGSGQVGCALLASLPQGIEAVAPSRSALDLSRPETLEQAVRAIAPDAILHAGAYTAVDKAEDEPSLCWTVNAEATAALARAAAALDIPLLYVSTDYVFSGASGRPYREDDPVLPLSVYGRSKLAGELAVQSLCPKGIILRTSWVFSSEGVNFPLRMLELGRSRPLLRIVADQHGAPTPAASVAETLWQLLENQPISGIYHYSGQPYTTWYDFAVATFAAAATHGYKIPAIEAITTAEYPTKTQRPLDARLDTTKIQILGIPAPDWREALESLIKKTF